MANIYIVRFTKTCHKQQSGLHVMHRHVLAETFEQALDKAREVHPDSPIQGVSLQNATEGMEVLNATEPSRRNSA